MTTTPLVVTGDAVLTEELQRLSAAVGVTLEVAADPAAALRGWIGPGLVLVGADLAEELSALSPARRAGVVVVSWGSAADDVYRTAVELGAEEVLALPHGEPAVSRRLADADEAGRRAAYTVGVLAGSGGAGASVLACALGQLAAEDGPVLVIDADPWGPGLDRLLGLEHADGVRWESLARTSGRLAGRSLREAVPRRDDLGVLTWAAGGGRLADVPVGQVHAAAVRGHDLVVVDLPRSGDASVHEAQARCDEVVVVVSATVPGVAAAARTLAQHPQRDRMRLVVRGHRLEPREVAAVLGLPLLATMRPERRLAETIELGLGPLRSPRGPLGRACTAVLRRAALTPEAAA